MVGFGGCGSGVVERGIEVARGGFVVENVGYVRPSEDVDRAADIVLYCVSLVQCLMLVVAFGGGSSSITFVAVQQCNSRICYGSLLHHMILWSGGASCRDCSGSVVTGGGKARL